MNTVPLSVLLRAQAALELCHKYHNDSPMKGQPFIETLRAMSEVTAHVDAIAKLTQIEVEA
jgi:hypothetical protein